MVNTTLNLYCGGLQEVEHLKVVLTEDKVAYRESVGDAGLSTSIQGPPMIIPGPSIRILSPSIRWVILVLLTPTQILQIRSRVERVGVTL